MVITPSNTTGFAGTSLDEPSPSPCHSPDTRAGTSTSPGHQGRVTALYIDYALSDVCPRRWPTWRCGDGRTARDVADQVDVVFITTDPDRDTPKAIGKWLSSFTWDQTTGLTRGFRRHQVASDTVGIFIDPREPGRHDDGHTAPRSSSSGRTTSPASFPRPASSPGDVAHDLQRLVEKAIAITTEMTCAS